MKLPPFVIGTDITQLSRWDPLTNPKRFAVLARRLMHPTELRRLAKGFPAIAPLLNDISQPESEIDRIVALQRLPNASKADIDTITTSSSSSKNDRSDNAINARKSRNAAVANLQALDPVKLHNLKQALAGRWAAKEAAKKAWGATLVSWKDLSVHYVPGGREPGSPGGGVEIVLSPFQYQRPAMVFDEMRTIHAQERERNGGGADDRGLGKMGQEDARARTGAGETMLQRGRLTVSHDGDYCVATVLAEPISPDIRAVLEKRWRVDKEKTSRGSETKRQSSQLEKEAAEEL